MDDSVLQRIGDVTIERVPKKTKRDESKSSQPDVDSAPVSTSNDETSREPPPPPPTEEVVLEDDTETDFSEEDYEDEEEGEDDDVTDIEDFQPNPESTWKRKPNSIGDEDVSLRKRHKPEEVTMVKKITQSPIKPSGHIPTKTPIEETLTEILSSDEEEGVHSSEEENVEKIRLIVKDDTSEPVSKKVKKDISEDVPDRVLLKPETDVRLPEDHEEEVGDSSPRPVGGEPSGESPADFIFQHLTNSEESKTTFPFEIKEEPTDSSDYDYDLAEKLREMGEISVQPVKKSDSTFRLNETTDPEQEPEVSVKKLGATDSEEEEKAERKIGNLRRNIREVMDENKLDEATLAAQRQEMERLRRVQEQQKIIREVQRQIAFNRQNAKTQNRVISLLSGNRASGANAAQASAASGSGTGSTVLVKLPNGETKPMTRLPKGQNVFEMIRTHKSINLQVGANRTNAGPRNLLTPSVSIAPVTKKPQTVTSSSSIAAPMKSPESGEKATIKPKKDVETIDVSSSDDDCIVLSEDDEEPEPEEDPSNSGMHTNDAYNVPDDQGRVLINVGHPPDEPDIFLAPQIARVIKPHQIGGVRFLFDNVIESISRFNTSTGFGCILAHSMGLGKTLQVVCFSDIFLRHTSAKTILCIMPINTLQNWCAEFNMWLPTDATNSPLLVHGEVRPRNFNLHVLNDSHKSLAARAKTIQEWSRDGGVLLIGYELYRLLSLKRNTSRPKKKKKPATDGSDVVDLEEDDKNKALFDEIHEALVKPGPDLVICDEGHRIKNSHASISQALKQIRSKRRVVLTGYPLQNNLLEYWCMVDFVRPNYLGTKTEFSNMFERPIQNGQCVDSTPQDVRLMRFRAHVLHSLLEGFVQRRSHAVLQVTLPQKEEYVLLVRMTPFQRKLYDTFMNDVVRTKTVPNPLKAFAVCCKIWNHPDVLYYFLKNREADEAVDIDLEEVQGTTTGATSTTAGGKKKSRPRTPRKDTRKKGSTTPAEVTPLKGGIDRVTPCETPSSTCTSAPSTPGPTGTQWNQQPSSVTSPATQGYTTPSTPFTTNQNSGSGPIYPNAPSDTGEQRSQGYPTYPPSEGATQLPPPPPTSTTNQYYQQNVPYYPTTTNSPGNYNQSATTTGVYSNSGNYNPTSSTAATDSNAPGYSGTNSEGYTGNPPPPSERQYAPPPQGYPANSQFGVSQQTNTNVPPFAQNSSQNFTNSSGNTQNPQNYQGQYQNYPPSSGYNTGYNQTPQGTGTQQQQTSTPSDATYSSNQTSATNQYNNSPQGPFPPPAGEYSNSRDGYQGQYQGYSTPSNGYPGYSQTAGGGYNQTPVTAPPGGSYNTGSGTPQNFSGPQTDSVPSGSTTTGYNQGGPTPSGYNPPPTGDVNSQEYSNNQGYYFNNQQGTNNYSWNNSWNSGNTWGQNNTSSFPPASGGNGPIPEGSNQGATSYNSGGNQPPKESQVTPAPVATGSVPAPQGGPPSTQYSQEQSSYQYDPSGTPSTTYQYPPGNYPPPASGNYPPPPTQYSAPNDANNSSGYYSNFSNQNYYPYPQSTWPPPSEVKTEVKQEIKQEIKTEVKDEKDIKPQWEQHGWSHSQEIKSEVKDEKKSVWPCPSGPDWNSANEKPSDDKPWSSTSWSEPNTGSTPTKPRENQSWPGQNPNDMGNWTKPPPEIRPESNSETVEEKKTEIEAKSETETETEDASGIKDNVEILPTAKLKEDGGINYDWAVELLKGYVPGIIENSAKMEILFCILRESMVLEDRILLFSQSLFTLNLIEELLQRENVPGKEEKWGRNVNYYRLDGSTSALEREKLINEFNSNPNIHLFMVSTRAGSLGINLVGANRVIVFDASWNPCHDTQAVCRVYRYGQKKPCFVYRLVMDNCLEKKIYDRQINKQGMSDRVVDECNPDAHLSMKDVTNLCWDDEKDTEVKDFSTMKDKYIDIVMQKVLDNHSQLLSREPFQHESLLVDRKEKKLSQAEKRMAKRSYEMEKQAVNNAARSTTYGGFMQHQRMGIHNKPIASVRPMQAELNSQIVRDGQRRSTRWIPAEVWQRQGMTAQEMTLPLDVVIPTNGGERGNIVLKAGQKVLVLKSPKGIYMQLECGKIVAIRTAMKMRGNCSNMAGKMASPGGQGAKNSSDESGDGNYPLKRGAQRPNLGKPLAQAAKNLPAVTITPRNKPGVQKPVRPFTQSSSGAIGPRPVNQRLPKNVRNPQMGKARPFLRQEDEHHDESTTEELEHGEMEAPESEPMEPETHIIPSSSDDEEPPPSEASEGSSIAQADEVLEESKGEMDSNSLPKIEKKEEIIERPPPPKPPGFQILEVKSLDKSEMITVDPQTLKIPPGPMPSKSNLKNYRHKASTKPPPVATSTSSALSRLEETTSAIGTTSDLRTSLDQITEKGGDSSSPTPNSRKMAPVAPLTPRNRKKTAQAPIPTISTQQMQSAPIDLDSDGESAPTTVPTNVPNPTQTYQEYSNYSPYYGYDSRPHPGSSQQPPQVIETSTLPPPEKNISSTAINSTAGGYVTQSQPPPHMPGPPPPMMTYGQTNSPYPPNYGAYQQPAYQPYQAYPPPPGGPPPGAPPGVPPPPFTGGFHPQGGYPPYQIRPPPPQGVAPPPLPNSGGYSQYPPYQPPPPQMYSYDYNQYPNPPPPAPPGGFNPPYSSYAQPPPPPQGGAQQQPMAPVPSNPAPAAGNPP